MIMDGFHVYFVLKFILNNEIIDNKPEVLSCYVKIVIATSFGWNRSTFPMKLVILPSALRTRSLELDKNILQLVVFSF